MQYALALLALGASTAVAQFPTPSGCQTSFSGTFSFQTANITTGAKMARGLDEVLGRPVDRVSQCLSAVMTAMSSRVAARVSDIGD